MRGAWCLGTNFVSLIFCYVYTSRLLTLANLQIMELSTQIADDQQKHLRRVLFVSLVADL